MRFSKVSKFKDVIVVLR